MAPVGRIPPTLTRAIAVLLTWLIIIFLIVFYVGDWVVTWPDVYTRLAWVFLLGGLSAFLKVIWTPKGWWKRAIDWTNRLLIGTSGGFLLLVAAAGAYLALLGGYSAEQSVLYAIVAALLLILGCWMVSWAWRHRRPTEHSGTAREAD